MYRQASQSCHSQARFCGNTNAVFQYVSAYEKVANLSNYLKSRVLPAPVAWKLARAHHGQRFIIALFSMFCCTQILF